MMADPETHTYYNSTWERAMVDNCNAESNFPLSLTQLKQKDEHQLYYNLPLVKVSTAILEK